MKYTYLGVESPLYKKSKAAAKKENNAVATSLDQYEEMKKKKTKFNVEFTRVDKSGELDCIKDGIRIRMVLKDGDTELTPLRRNQALGKNYEVTVKKVDREKNEVTVAYENPFVAARKAALDNLANLLKKQKDIRDKADMTVQKRLDELMNGELSGEVLSMKEKTRARWRNIKYNEFMVEEMNRLSNKWIVVPAIVKYVDRDDAVVDILKLNIPGFLSKKNYGYTHISDLSKRISPGEVIDVAVLGALSADSEEAKKIQNLKKDERAYVVGRTPLVENPWKTLPYNEGDKVKITCTEVAEGHWFGVIKGYEDIEIYCEMPDAATGTNKVIKGQTYNCTIYRVKKETQLIKARTYSRVVNRRR